MEGPANPNLSLRFATGLLAAPPPPPPDVDAAVFIIPNFVLSFYTPSWGLTTMFCGMNVNLTIFLGWSWKALEIINSEGITDKILIMKMKFLFHLTYAWQLGVKWGLTREAWKWALIRMRFLHWRNVSVDCYHHCGNKQQQSGEELHGYFVSVKMLLNFII